MEHTSLSHTKKIRLGLYMYTPMLGGAEMYFKDLIWNLDRERFDITVFYEPWQEFIDFLDLTHAPSLRVYPIKVKEVGGHFGAKELTNVNAPKHIGWGERQFIRLQTLHKRIPCSVLKIPGRIGYAVLQCALLPINSVNLFFAFQKHHIDILHVFNGGYPGAQSARLAAAAAKLTGCKYCIMSVCNTPAPPHFPKTLEQSFDYLVRRSFNIVLVPAEFIGDGLIKFHRFQNSQIKKIPYSVAEPEDYGAKASFQKKTILSIGMVASFLPHKGHRYFLEAFSKIHAQLPKIRAILIGDGPTIGAMRALASKLKIDSFIDFKGHCPLKETLNIIREMDIFVLPSEMEGMPYVILHAMSLGKPVIATPVGAIPDIVASEKTGFIVPVGDISALAEAIIYLLNNPGLRDNMGKAARQRYLDYFTLKTMVLQHESLYQNLTT